MKFSLSFFFNLYHWINSPCKRTCLSFNRKTHNKYILFCSHCHRDYLRGGLWPQPVYSEWISGPLWAGPEKKVGRKLNLNLGRHEAAEAYSGLLDSTVQSPGYPSNRGKVVKRWQETTPWPHLSHHSFSITSANKILLFAQVISLVIKSWNTLF